MDRNREFQIQKIVDAVSPTLYLVTASGAHFPTMTLALHRSSSAQGDFLNYTFKLVFVTSISWGGSSGGDTPSESVSFAFGAMQVSYAKQDAAGKLGIPAITAWNVVTNQPNLTVTASGA